MVKDLIDADIVLNQSFWTGVYTCLAETIPGHVVSRLHKICNKGYAQNG